MLFYFLPCLISVFHDVLRPCHVGARRTHGRLLCQCVPEPLHQAESGGAACPPPLQIGGGEAEGEGEGARGRGREGEGLHKCMQFAIARAPTCVFPCARRDIAIGPCWHIGCVLDHICCQTDMFLVRVRMRSGLCIVANAHHGIMMDSCL